MRKIVIAAALLGAFCAGGCEDSSSGSGGGAAPSATAAPSAAHSAAPATSGGGAPSASPSGSAKAENDKPKKAEGPKDHKLRLKALEEAWASHDAKKVSALYADDAVVKAPGAPDMKGHEAIEKELTGIWGAFKDATMTVGRKWEKDKHTVVFEWVGKGTNTGDAPEMGIPKATNKPFGFVGATLLMVNDDGLIKEEHRYLDDMTIVGQVKPEKEHPVRAIVTAPPNGDKHYEASTAKEVKDAKDEKEKAELAKVLEMEKKNIEVEDKFMAELNGGKVEETFKHFPEDTSLVDYTQDKDIKGLKELKEFVKVWMKAIPDLKVKSNGAFGDGEFVIEEFEYTGTHKGPLGKIKASNKPVDMHQLEVDEFKDGKIVKSWSWGNNVELLTEIGVLPPPGSAPPAPSGSAAKK
jgi:steroid delta-isomerase-like uncharacterized protein